MHRTQAKQRVLLCRPRDPVRPVYRAGARTGWVLCARVFRDRPRDQRNSVWQVWVDDRVLYMLRADHTAPSHGTYDTTVMTTTKIEYIQCQASSIQFVATLHLEMPMLAYELNLCGQVMPAMRCSECARTTCSTLRTTHNAGCKIRAVGEKVTIHPCYVEVVNGTNQCVGCGACVLCFCCTP